LASRPYKAEIGPGAVIYMANNMLPLDRKNWFVPAWAL